MQLLLKYHDQPLRPAAAAFLRGGDAGAWLQEISSWGIPLSGLTCLIVPESTASVSPAGLLVIFPQGSTPAAELISHPYGVLADKLYLPVNAQLSPAADADELKSLLLWEWHIYHPSLGFTGFEKADRLDLGNLLDYTPEFERQWRYARPGVNPPARLQHITLEKNDPEEVLKSLEDVIKKKPLSDINKDEEKTGAKKLLEDAKSAAVRGVLKGLNSLLNGSPSRKSSSRPSSGGNFSGSFGSGGGMGGFSSFSYSPGPLTRFKSWLAKKVLDLEKERNKELNRLLQMFDEDIQKALEYAIPLGGMFADRGVAPPSVHLGRHGTNFDLGRLGGGLRSDSWDVNEHYEKSLRQKYQEAANNAIANKDFKRAAYIYAHLLGQYQEAANVLEQGRHYREAAALYQKFLSNKLGAAQCLEKGGLLQEAIPLYLELDQQEKAGDLLMETGQKVEAEKCYRKVSDKALSDKHYIEAARILNEKLREPDEAMAILLDGWYNSSQPEACLMQYYRLAADNDMDQLLKEVKDIYEEHTSESRHVQFLNTLAAAKNTYRDERLDTLSTGIAYEIISEQAAQGNINVLERLRQFVPGDNLLNADTQRYIHSKRRERKPTAPSLPKSFSLKATALGHDVEWITATSWKDQFLALGYSDGKLHLVRGNWKGELELWQWHFAYSSGISINFLSYLAGGNRIYVVSNRPLPFEELVLKADSRFENELTVVSPGWLSQIDYTGISILPDGNIALLQTSQTGSQEINELAYYTASGMLQNKYICEDPHPDDPVPITHWGLGEMHKWNGDFFYFDNWIQANGIVTKLDRKDFKVLAFTLDNSSPRLFVRPFDPEELGGLMQTHTYLGTRVYEFMETPFAQNLAIDHLALLQDNYVVVSESAVAVVYRIEGVNINACRTIRTASTISTILPTDRRKQFALLDENGNMTVHEVEEE